MSTRCLLLSNSTAAGFPYLQLWVSTIMAFLSGGLLPPSSPPSSSAPSPGVRKNVLFVPFAGVTIGWDEYTARVQAALPDLNVTGIHRTADMLAAVNETEVIMIGGGNTFHLLLHLHKQQLIPAIRDRVVDQGVPYIGWSAGSNVAAPDIATTNDMPVVWPEQGSAIGLIDFNINPHYNNWKPAGLQGEGRDDRLNEAITATKRLIVALSEGVAILGQDHSLYLVKSPAEKRSPDQPLLVKVWKPRPQPPFFHVTDVSTNQTEEIFSLDQFLIDP